MTILPAGDAAETTIPHPMREARIDLDAVRTNLAAIRRIVAPALVMAVVKADAYGHGALPVARAAVEAGADWLGVADIDEALALRDDGIAVPVLAWLHGTDADFESAIDADIDLGISSAAQLERAAAAGPAAVHLKLDTGLSRNGIAPDDAPATFARAAELQRTGTLRVRGILTHLSNTSRADDDAQIASFTELVGAARASGLDPQLRHVAATQAALTREDARLDMVRIGIGLYGLAPADGVEATSYGLRPAMELAGSVAAVRRVPLGSGVSYGFTHRVMHETTLALVPLGYADGVPRAASNTGEVLIGHGRFPIVGRIAMDQFIVDVGDADVSVGDRVVLWGDPSTGAPSVEEWAEAAGTINYELVTRIGPRVPRVAVR